MFTEMQNYLCRFGRLILGRPLDPRDDKIFHKLSLVAFFAWVGLGADGLSSSCYGPEEAFKVLLAHPYLALLVALASALTVFIISSSYSQIIELFPSGGGGYLVASKLLSPTFGMISGCALLVDYVLTITTSVAGGADALFSSFPSTWLHLKLPFECACIIGLTLLNLRGVKESVLPLVPIFLTFLATHAFALVYCFFTHMGNVAHIGEAIRTDFSSAHTQLGMGGMLLLLLRAYSMGAGTFTGIEAVSNGLPILREPRVKTAKRTMHYMAWSLALTAGGLMIAYLLFQILPVENKTLNAVLFETMSKNWPAPWGATFVWVSLIAESLLLLIAAQAGFLDGPRVLSNMAVDHWMPTKFAMLSDRFVTRNGVLLMGVASVILVLASKGVITFLIVLYSINVFITFSLSQLGMVRHWWTHRGTGRWKKGLFINGLGLLLTTTILIILTAIKFKEGGWITLVVTGSLIALSYAIHNHYRRTRKLLGRLDDILEAVEQSRETGKESSFNPKGKTAVVLVNGFNGLGLHTLLNVNRYFAGVFKNFIFIQVGVLDAGNFKGPGEVARLQTHLEAEGERYVGYMRSQGYYAESLNSVGTEVVEHVMTLSPEIQKKYPDAVFFGGQLVFPEESFFSRWLHNYVVFALQRRYYHAGIPFLIMPIRV